MRRLAISLLCLLLVCCGGEEDRGAPERIVLVVADTLRADHVGAYGGSVSTPNLDALSERGEIFEQALASYHQTSMSMASLFTGLTPSVEAPGGQSLPWAKGTFCGMARFRSGDEACVPASLTTLAEDLSQAGYATLGVTSNPLLFRPYGFDQGFDVWREVGDVPNDGARRQSRREHAESRTGVATNRAVGEVLQARSSDRFFLYVHYLDVHDWLLLGRPYRKGVAAFDRYLGELLGLLEAENLLDGAVVIVTGDHGESLHGEEHPLESRLHVGNPSYESVLRVPLIVAPPVFGDSSAPIRGQDLRGLIRELAGGTPDPPPEPELFLSEVRYRTYRRDGFKSVWPRNADAPLLFDLTLDPGESRDVAAAHPEVLDSHERRVKALSEELAAGSRPKDVLDANTANRLRVLGYID